MIFQPQTESNRITVLAVGPSPKVCGGISTLIANIRDHCPSSIDYHVVGTYSGYMEDFNSSGRWHVILRQAGVYCLALIQILWATFRFSNKVFHVHLSQEGSLLRKGIICILLRLSRSSYLIHMHAAEDKLFHPWVPQRARNAMLWGIRACRYCVVLNPYWADYYMQRFSIGPPQIVILPNPADLPPHVPDRAGRRLLQILFLGRIGARKGAFDLIRAFAALPNDLRSNSRLVLAGDGDVHAASQLAAETGCKAQISVTGWLDRSTTQQLLAESDLFALPSYAEGMAISVLEALAWGLPVVTTPSGGSKAFLEHRHNCLLVEPGNISEISKAIQTLCEDEQTRLSIGREAQQTAAMLSIDKYIEKLLLLYRDVAGAATHKSTRVRREQSTFAD